jgi:hypothetical protein
MAALRRRLRETAGVSAGTDGPLRPAPAGRRQAR